MGLSPKQQIFVDVYVGNATGAAREAGYKSPEVEGFRLLRNAKIVAALEERNAGVKENRIYTRQQRQQFWTDILTGKIGEVEVDKDGKEVNTPAAIKDRLKASELLGKSQADFIERKHITGDLTVAQAIEAESLIEEKKRLG